VIAPAARKTLRKLSRNEQERILAAIRRLPAGDVRRLKGRRDEWRLRVGDWRALIRLDQNARLIVGARALEVLRPDRRRLGAHRANA
jgi:mRNA interferase RelE/StbE